MPLTFTTAANAIANLTETKRAYDADRLAALTDLTGKVAEQIELAIQRFMVSPKSKFPLQLEIHNQFHVILSRWDFRPDELDPVFTALEAAGWQVKRPDATFPNSKWLDCSLVPKRPPEEEILPPSNPVGQESRPPASAQPAGAPISRGRGKRGHGKIQGA